MKPGAQRLQDSSLKCSNVVRLTLDAGKTCLVIPWCGSTTEAFLSKRETAWSAGQVFVPCSIRCASSYSQGSVRHCLGGAAGRGASDLYLRAVGEPLGDGGRQARRRGWAAIRRSSFDIIRAA